MPQYIFRLTLLHSAGALCASWQHYVRFGAGGQVPEMLAMLDVLALHKQQEQEKTDADDASVSSSSDPQVMKASPVLPCSPCHMSSPLQFWAFQLPLRWPLACLVLPKCPSPCHKLSS